MWQQIFASFFIALSVGLTGCIWNTKLPYQQSMDTYVGGSKTLLEQVTQVTEGYPEICSVYNANLNAYNSRAKELGNDTLADNEACSLDRQGDIVWESNQLAQILSQYHNLIAQHSPQAKRGLAQIEKTGSTLSEKCLSEGSRCNFDGLTSERLSVVQKLASKMVSSYQNNQTHESLSEFIGSTTKEYRESLSLLTDAIGDIRALLDITKRQLDTSFLSQCSGKQNNDERSVRPSHCTSEWRRKFIEEDYPLKVRALELIVERVNEHLEALDTFKSEVLAKKTEDERRESLREFAQDVLRTGYDIDAAF